MISVIVPTLDNEASLVACLAPLVPAAMEGLVRELIVVDAGSTDATLEIADDAGAEILRGEGGFDARLIQGAARAKGPWLLLLDPRVRLEYGWESVVQQHISGPRGPARFRLKHSDATWLQRFQTPKATAQLVLKGRDGGGSALGGDDRLGRGGRNHGRLLDVAGWL